MTGSYQVRENLTKYSAHTSSLIQTLLSVLESHQVGCIKIKQFADYTAGRESHPAPKNYFSSKILSLAEDTVKDL